MLTTLPPETTDLERRVLAHERILQSVIGYMSRTDPRFVEHLSRRFVEPMAMARREHDHWDADDYAEEFIRAVLRLREWSPPNAARLRQAVKSKRQADQKQGKLPPYPPAAEVKRVQVRERHGVWEVKVDGVFWGDYHEEEYAREAAALARLSLQ